MLVLLTESLPAAETGINWELHVKSKVYLEILMSVLILLHTQNHSEMSKPKFVLIFYLIIVYYNICSKS